MTKIENEKVEDVLRNELENEGFELSYRRIENS